MHTSGMVPTVEVDLGWSLESKVMGYCDHLRGLEASTPGGGGQSPAKDASDTTRHLIAPRRLVGEVVVLPRGLLLGSVRLRVLLVVIVVVVVPASPSMAAATAAVAAATALLLLTSLASRGAS